MKHGAIGNFSVVQLITNQKKRYTDDADSNLKLKRYELFNEVSSIQVHRSKRLHLHDNDDDTAGGHSLEFGETGKRWRSISPRT